MTAWYWKIRPGEEINISDREAEQDFSPQEAGGTAEKVLERADHGQERRAGKKAARQAGQVAAADAGPRPSSRLQLSEEERSTPELKKYIRKSDQRPDRLDTARAAIPKETVKIKEKVFDEASGRAKTRVRREVRDKPPSVWTQQKRLSPKKRNLLRNAPLTKPQAKARPACTLRNGRSRPDLRRNTARYPAPRRKRVFSVCRAWHNSSG